MDLEASPSESDMAEIPKVQVIRDDFECCSESDLEEEIYYQGTSPLDDGITDDSIDTGDAEDAEECMLTGLQRINLEAHSDIGDDEGFAELAGSFLRLSSPSTLMEDSLDGAAAEFLHHRKAAGRQKRGKGKGHLERKQKQQQKAPKFTGDADPWVYDGPYSVGGINFRQINRELKTFINDDVESELEMDPMPPLPRKFLHELAHLYGLKSKSTGSGRERHCVLYKTERSGIPRNAKQVLELVSRADKAIVWMDKAVTKGAKFSAAAVSGRAKTSRRSAKGRRDGGSEGGQSARPGIGTVVGLDAPPVSEDNIGNKMLRRLGWKPGEGLGSSPGGIVDPLTAVVRGKRTGLGHT